MIHIKVDYFYWNTNKNLIQSEALTLCRFGVFCFTKRYLLIECLFCVYKSLITSPLHTLFT